MRCKSVSFTVPHRPAIIPLAFYDRLSASDCFHSKRILQPPCFCTLTPHIQSSLRPGKRQSIIGCWPEAGGVSLSVSLLNTHIQQRQLDRILSTSICCDYNLHCEVLTVKFGRGKCHTPWSGSYWNKCIFQWNYTYIHTYIHVFWHLIIYSWKQQGKQPESYQTTCLGDEIV